MILVAEKQGSLKDSAKVQSGEDIMAKYELKISSKNSDGALNNSQLMLVLNMCILNITIYVLNYYSMVVYLTT